MDKKDKNLLLDYLNSQDLMSIATSDGKGSLWSATVYFTADEKLNFYFMSGPNTEHCKNIAKNPNVSLTVADSHQNPIDDKFGIQVAGKCNNVTDNKELKGVLRVWNKKFSEKTAPPFEKMKDRSPFYKIKPTRLKIFDSKKKDKTRKFEL